MPNDVKLQFLALGVAAMVGLIIFVVYLQDTRARARRAERLADWAFLLFGNDAPTAEELKGLTDEELDDYEGLLQAMDDEWNRPY